MQAKEIVNRLRQFGAYPKTLEDFRVKTFGGAAGVYTDCYLERASSLYLRPTASTLK